MTPGAYWGKGDFKIGSLFFIDFAEMGFELEYTIVSPFFNKEAIKGI